MKTKKKILIALIATAIFGYGIVVNEKDSPIPINSSSNPQPQSIQLNNSNSLPHPHPKPQETSSLNRDEVLKKSLKGYREQTYWGNEHLIKETTKDLNDKEFSRYVEDEIKSKDLDVYWGAEY